MTQWRRALAGSVAAMVVASLGGTAVVPSAGADEPGGAGVSVYLDPVHDPVALGQLVRYRATVNNLGPDAGEGVSVQVDLDPTTTVESATVVDGPSCTVVHHRATCPVGMLEANGQAFVDLAVSVATTGTVTSSASITAANAVTPPEGFPTTDDATVEVIAPAADLVLSDITPYTGQDPVVGGVATVDAVLADNGPSAATDVRVVVAVPTDVAVSGATVDGGTCNTATAGTVTCTLGSIDPDAAVSIQVRLAPTVVGPIAYSATVTQGGPGELHPDDNAFAGSLTIRAADDPEDPPTDPPAEGAVTLTPFLAGPVAVYQGDLIDYTVALGVSGPNPARATTLTLQIPAELSYELASTSCGVPVSPTTVVCQLGDLAPGPQRVYHLYLRANTPVHAATVTLTAASASPTVDPGTDTTSTYLTVATTGAPQPLDFGVVFSQTRPTVLLGRLFQEHVVLDDADEAFNAMDVHPEVTIEAPDGLVIEAARIGDTPCAIPSPPTSAVCTPPGPLSSAEDIYLALRGVSVGSYTLTASVAATTYVDPNPANDQDATPYPIQVVAGAGAIRPLAGCGEHVLGRFNGDNSEQVALPFPLSFGGSPHDALYVNGSGSVTFDGSLYSGAVPTLADVSGPFIAPFLANSALRQGSYPELGPVQLVPGTVTYGPTTVGGRPAFCVVWDDLGSFESNPAEVTNTFQLLIIDRGQGDFDLELAYDQLTWDQTTPNLPAALAGFRLDPAQAFVFPGSNEHGALLDTDQDSGLIHGTRQAEGQLGRYRFSIRGGAIQPADHAVDRPPTLDLPTNITVAEGTPIDLTPVAGDPDGDPVQLFLNSALPGTSSWNGVTFSWPTDLDDAGTYSIGFRALSGQLVVDKTVTIVVTETATVDAGADQLTTEGQPIGVAGAKTDHAGGQTWTYAAAGPVDGGTTCTFADPHALRTDITCNDDGVFTVTLSLDGIPVRDSATLTVGNVRPFPTITSPATASPGRAAVSGRAVHVTAAGAPEPSTNDLPGVTCSIAWGDGTTTPGVATPGTPETGTQQGVFCVADHTYGGGGDYVVTVGFDDGDEAPATTAITVPVRTAPTSAGAPTPSVASPNRGTFTLTWAPSSTDVVGDPITYRLERRPSSGGPWTTVTTGLSASSAPITAEGEGAWTYRAVAVAPGGETAGATSATVVVDRTVPVAAITCPASVLVGSTASAPWTASDDRAGLATPASGAVALSTATAGTRTATAPAPVDRAGNTGTAVSCAYVVSAPVLTATRLVAGPAIAHLLPGLEITLHLSATLTTATGTPVVGRTVVFRAGATTVCAAATDAKGVAACANGRGLLRSLLAGGYTADFAGDAAYLPSLARGGLITIG